MVSQLKGKVRPLRPLFVEGVSDDKDWQGRLGDIGGGGRRAVTEGVFLFVDGVCGREAYSCPGTRASLISAP